MFHRVRAPPTSSTSTTYPHMATEGQEPASVSSNKLVRALSFLSGQLNFYRLHIVYLCVRQMPPLYENRVVTNRSAHYPPGRSIFTPLIFSGIFYASNGEAHISYIDSLYNCVSAMVVCGLATVDLSSLTPWQQVILFIQMCIGNPVRSNLWTIVPSFIWNLSQVVVSWVVVYTRR